MKTKHSVLIFTILFALLILTACKPAISDDFRNQTTRLLEEGSTLKSMTGQGVNYPDYRNQLAKVKGAYDLAIASWPKDFSEDSKLKFDQAFTGWDLTLNLWGMKIGDKDNPLEPDINHYKTFLDYAGSALVIKNHPASFIVEAYRGKKYLPFDENISVLLTIAGGQFDDARKLLIEALK